MARKDIISGIKETEKGYVINPLKLRRYYLFFGIIALILFFLPVLVPRQFEGLFGLLFFIYMVFIVIYSFRKQKSLLGSMLKKGKDKYNLKYESKGLFKEKRIQIKK